MKTHAAHRATVRPRVVCPDAGGSRPLEEVVSEFVARNPQGVLGLYGGPGMGKTTALEHLAAVLPADSGLVFLDESGPDEISAAAATHPVVAAFGHRDVAPSETFALADWGEDEFIEYLLATHSHACASVIARLRRAADRGAIPGVPRLWRMILDRLVTDESLTSVWSALVAVCEEIFVDDVAAQRYAMAAVCGNEVAPELLQHLQQSAADPRMRQLIRHELVQVWLAGAGVATAVESDARESRSLLGWSYPERVLHAAARSLRSSTTATARLLTMADDRRRPGRARGLAASLLHLTGTHWRPASRQPVQLPGASLAGIEWREIDLRRADLRWANLSRAVLDGAVLSKARLSGADLSGATLRAADMHQATGSKMSFRGADLTGVKAAKCHFTETEFQGARLGGGCWDGTVFEDATLSGTDFRGASLVAAEIRACELMHADLRDANLEQAKLVLLDGRGGRWLGARFARATFSRCCFSDVDLSGADFREAILANVDFTGARMPAANLAGASISSAGLADVDWEGVNLRGAELRGSSFHMGSSRSGLLDSPLASEGTRTGFYTDDYHEQHYKSPEEIRKANLCGADLRGARIEDVDFYLVDLRGARLDDDQRVYMEKCGAIL